MKLRFIELILRSPKFTKLPILEGTIAINVKDIIYIRSPNNILDECGAEIRLRHGETFVVEESYATIKNKLESFS